MQLVGFVNRWGEYFVLHWGKLLTISTTWLVCMKSQKPCSSPVTLSFQCAAALLIRNSFPLPTRCRLVVVPIESHSQGNENRSSGSHKHQRVGITSGRGSRGATTCTLQLLHPRLHCLAVVLASSPAPRLEPTLGGAARGALVAVGQLLKGTLAAVVDVPACQP
jgi:hypothetical protein